MHKDRKTNIKIKREKQTNKNGKDRINQRTTEKNKRKKARKNKKQSRQKE